MSEFTGMSRVRELKEFEVRHEHDDDSLEPMVLMRVRSHTPGEPDQAFWLRPATARILGAELLTQGARNSWGPVGWVSPSTA